jgi:hypothetical protein
MTNPESGPDAVKPWWCETCESWRHTQPCGRDECPVLNDSPVPAVPAVERPIARYTVQPPSASRAIETHQACLYTHVRTCREDWPDDKDHWCGYCSGITSGLTELPVPAVERIGPSEALRIARKALTCLYIVVPSGVADDVNRKVEAAFAALSAPPVGEIPWDKITRLEVIDESGRRLSRWNVSVEPSVQDDGRTLKLFIAALAGRARPTSETPEA